MTIKNSLFIPLVMIFPALVVNHLVTGAAIFTALVTWLLCMIAYLLAWRLPVDTVRRGLLAAGQALAVVAISQWLGWRFNLLTGAGFASRPPGALLHPNVLAAVLVPLMIVTVECKAWRQLAPLALALLLTGSRAGLLAAAAAGLVYIVTDQAARRWLAHPWPIFAGLAVIGMSLLINMYGGVSHSEIAHRLYYWQVGIQTWRDHIWIGVGVGGYNQAYLDAGQHLTRTARHAHNLVINILAESGLIGFGVFLFFVWKLARIFRQRAAQRAAGAFLAAITVICTFDCVMWVPGAPVLLLLCWSTAEIGGDDVERLHLAGPRRRMIDQLAIGIFGLLPVVTLARLAGVDESRGGYIAQIVYCVALAGVFYLWPVYRRGANHDGIGESGPVDTGGVVCVR
jgi:O-antigen ligase